MPSPVGRVLGRLRRRLVEPLRRVASALDQEARAMLQRAQPLPRFPAEMAGDSRSFSAPIRFSLQ